MRGIWRIIDAFDVNGEPFPVSHYSQASNDYDMVAEPFFRNIDFDHCLLVTSGVFNNKSRIRRSSICGLNDNPLQSRLMPF